MKSAPSDVAPQLTWPRGDPNWRAAPLRSDNFVTLCCGSHCAVGCTAMLAI